MYPFVCFPPSHFTNISRGRSDRSTASKHIVKRGNQSLLLSRLLPAHSSSVLFRGGETEGSVVQACDTEVVQRSDDVETMDVAAV